MNNVILWNGDCLELMKNISDKNGADVVLLCYEKADAFCHRHLVSDWLHSYNIDCEELVFGGKNV